MNTRKLTCAPEPPPICSVVDGVTVCVAPPIRCVVVCDNPGPCVVTCCAAFMADPVAVPTTHATTLALMVLAVLLIAFTAIRRKP